ncbi:MAG: TraR/DksA family transcriptional regulator [Bacteroidales bacterium]|nr:TraR/DksA family transcriptional regulator [Bacteroidales bacterium]MBQ9313204.1 TraR/DksA family transcriptional regulator [Bacteroidales bacterium]
MEEKVRYTDEELQEFKKLIMDKLAVAKANLEELKAEAFNKNSNGTDDTSPTFKAMEDESSNVQLKEENARLAARQQKYIKDLEAALTRIENKTYGICRVTGKLIPKERLRLVPHATLSIEAKMQQNKK